MIHLSGVASHEGYTRAGHPNEDSYLVLHGQRQDGEMARPGGLFAVADGMGGLCQGQLASKLAVQTLAQALAPLLSSGEPFTDLKYLTLLVTAVQAANAAIRARIQQGEGKMGTTLTAALVIGSNAYIAMPGEQHGPLLEACSNGIVSLIPSPAPV